MNAGFVQAYVSQFAGTLLMAGQDAYNKLGRGTLFCFPKRDQGNGHAEVRYFTEQMMIEDDDPSVPFIQTYDPEFEVLFLMAIEAPGKQVYLFRITRQEGGTSVELLDLKAERSL
jgi:hypothetical protein